QEAFHGTHTKAVFRYCARHTRDRYRHSDGWGSPSRAVAAKARNENLDRQDGEGPDTGSVAGNSEPVRRHIEGFNSKIGSADRGSTGVRSRRGYEKPQR